jgi:hypothetical protein
VTDRVGSSTDQAVFGTRQGQKRHPPEDNPIARCIPDDGLAVGELRRYDIAP